MYYKPFSQRCESVSVQPTESRESGFSKSHFERAGCLGRPSPPPLANAARFTRRGADAVLPAETPSALRVRILRESGGKQPRSALAGNLRRYLHIGTQKERTNTCLADLPGFEFLATLLFI